MSIRTMLLRMAATYGFLIGAIYLISNISICHFTPIDGLSSAEHVRLNKELGNAKQIYLGILMYAGDHNGNFPNQTVDGNPLTNANDAFRVLVPEYIPQKSVFYSTASKWTPKPPNDRIITRKTPIAGENSFAYTPNLTDVENRDLPLVATGFAKGTPGIYSADHQEPGSKTGKYGVVIVRVDGSAKKVVSSAPDFRIYDKLSPHEKRDIFKPAHGWLRPDQAPLNPEG